MNQLLQIVLTESLSSWIRLTGVVSYHTLDLPDDVVLMP